MKTNNFFQELINFVGACFDIVAGRNKRVNRLERLLSGIVCLFISGMSMFGIVKLDWVIFPSVKYTWASIGCRWSEAMAYGNGDWYFYQAYRAMKDKLIASSDMAAFLSDCANTGIGKAVQITCLLIAFCIFMALVYWIGMSFVRIGQAIQEAYLVKHPYSKVYKTVMDDFINSCRSTTVSSQKMMNNRLYSVYCCEARVINLMRAKMEREDRERAYRSA